MAYDFEALESGPLHIILNNHNDPTKTQSYAYYVEKGQKYTIDYHGVQLRERA